MFNTKLQTTKSLQKLDDGGDGEEKHGADSHGGRSWNTYITMLQFCYVRMIKFLNLR